MTQNESSEIMEKWMNGVPFHFAWIEFGHPHAVRTYLECTSLGGQQNRQMLMVADLWSGLCSGQFQAFGKSVAPKISDGPMMLPVHTFAFAPPHEVGNSDDFEIAGCRYVNVTVVRALEADADSPADEQPDPILPEVTGDGAPELDASPAKKRPGGRRDTYPYARTVLCALYELEGNSTLSAEQLYPDFKSEFARQYPDDKYQIFPPSVRTLRDQIKRYRQELAETGKS